MNMTRNYLILVNGKLWARKLTQVGAQRVADMLIERGLRATVAYAVTSEYQPMGVK